MVKLSEPERLKKDHTHTHTYTHTHTHTHTGEGERRGRKEEVKKERNNMGDIL